MQTWKKFKTEQLHEAETLSWKSLNSNERKDLLKNAGLPASFAKESWKELDFRAKERLGKMINKTTGGEFRMDESLGGPGGPSRQMSPADMHRIGLPSKKPKIKYAKIMKGLRDSQGPFSVVAIKRGKVVGQKHSIKNSKMLPIEVNDMADDYPGATISIESKGGEILNTFLKSYLFHL